ncbi:MAG: response regulator [Chloroflexota bacterium]|nr:response regulator [Chloroflexota bacterium]
MNESKGHILLVDDEESIREGISRKLRAENFTCVPVADGMEALELASVQHFDLVLLDVKMPGMSGLEVLAQLTASHPGTRVIMATGADDMQTAIKAMKLGACDYVTKPFNLSTLTKRIEKVLEIKSGITGNNECHAIMSCQTLREVEALYHELMDHISDTVLKVTGGTITWCNSRTREMLDYNSNELIGKPISSLFPEEIKPLEAAGTCGTGAKITEQHEIHSITRIRKKDGSTADIELFTWEIPLKVPAEFIAIIHDLTQRDPAETRLKEPETRFTSLVNIAGELGIAIAIAQDREDLKRAIVTVNNAFCSLSGYSSEELLQKTEQDVLCNDCSQEKRAHHGYPETGEDVQDCCKLTMLCKDGSRRHIEASCIDIPMNGKNATMICCKMAHTDETTANDEERIKENVQLAGRLATVGELAAGIAHELNNPIAAIQMFAELLSSRKDIDETLKKDLDTIYREALRAARISQNLLSFARKHKTERSLVCINTILEKSLELHAYRMNVNNIEIVKRLDPDIPQTMADLHQLQEVFVNIITNADQIMTETNGQGRLCISTYLADDVIRIVFTDDGPGIPENNLNKIFDPFFTTKDIGKGTGLGLSICAAIIRRHHGTIYATSKPGEGASFVVEIPIILRDEETIEPMDTTQIRGAYL